MIYSDNPSFLSFPSSPLTFDCVLSRSTTPENESPSQTKVTVSVPSPKKEVEREREREREKGVRK